MGCCGGKEEEPEAEPQESKPAESSKDEEPADEPSEAPLAQDSPSESPPGPVSPPKSDSNKGSALGRDSFRDRLNEVGPNQLLIICFFKPNCEKCNLVDQYFESLVATYPDVLFLDANITQNPEAVTELNLQSVPTFIAFRNHREVGRYEGTDKEAIEGLVNTYNVGGERSSGS